MFWTFVGTLFTFAIIVGAGYALATWAKDSARLALGRTRLDPLVRELIVSMVRPVIVFIAAYAGLAYLAVDLTPLVAVFGAAGLAIALALKDSLSGVAAGGLLLTIRPYDGGDWVEVAGLSGSVVEFDLLTVTLKQGDGVVVTLPNELVLKSPIRNYTRNGLRRIAVEVRVDPAADLTKASATLLATVSAEDRVLDDPEPTVRIGDLAPQGSQITAMGWVKASDYAVTRSDLLVAVDGALKKAKIARAKPLAMMTAP